VLGGGVAGERRRRILVAAGSGVGYPQRQDAPNDDCERKTRHRTTHARGAALTRADHRQPRIRLRRRRPFGGEGTSASCCLTGPGAPPGRPGEDARTDRPPPVPGKGKPGRPDKSTDPLQAGR
jgi:hypothetical protein